MRINKFIALSTGISRRKADDLIERGMVLVNGVPPEPGTQIEDSDTVTINGQPISANSLTTILLNKPLGYVCSRNGQGSKTVYDLLPDDLHHLKPVGRLDKYSSGLLVMTNDGNLANSLTHPSNQKQKIYRVTLDKSLSDRDKTRIEHGVMLEDGTSKLGLTGHDATWIVTMYEGRNRQIRRTFSELGYNVTRLHRTHFGPYDLSLLKASKKPYFVVK